MVVVRALQLHGPFVVPVVVPLLLSLLREWEKRVASDHPGRYWYRAYGGAASRATCEAVSSWVARTFPELDVPARFLAAWQLDSDSGSDSDVDSKDEVAARARDRRRRRDLRSKSFPLPRGPSSTSSSMTLTLPSRSAVPVELASAIREIRHELNVLKAESECVAYDELSRDELSKRLFQVHHPLVVPRLFKAFAFSPDELSKAAERVFHVRMRAAQDKPLRLSTKKQFVITTLIEAKANPIEVHLTMHAPYFASSLYSWWIGGLLAVSSIYGRWLCAFVHLLSSHACCNLAFRSFSIVPALSFLLWNPEAVEPRARAGCSQQAPRFLMWSFAVIIPRSFSRTPQPASMLFIQVICTVSHFRPCPSILEMTTRHTRW